MIAVKLIIYAKLSTVVFYECYASSSVKKWLWILKLIRLLWNLIPAMTEKYVYFWYNITFYQMLSLLTKRSDCIVKIYFTPCANMISHFIFTLPTFAFFHTLKIEIMLFCDFWSIHCGLVKTCGISPMQMPSRL